MFVWWLIGALADDGRFATEVRGRKDTSAAAFTTTIDVADDAPSLASPSIAELVAATPGATVRRMGGPGDFATLAIRGSTSTQAGIYLDGALINSASVGTVDLSTLLVSDLARVNVHRGFTPLSLGPDGFFGALELESLRPRGFGVLAVTGIGAFGARQLGASVSDSFGTLAARVALLYSGKRGDFSYFDDGGTPLNLSDDSRRARSNNQQDSGQLHVDVRWREWRLSLLAFGKAQGAPAPISAVPSEATFAMVRPLLTFGADRLQLAPEWHARVRLTHVGQLNETRHFGSDESSLESDTRLQGSVTWSGLAWLTLSAGPYGAAQAFAVRRPADAHDLGRESRQRYWAGGFVSADLSFFDRRVLLSTGTRVDGAFDTGTFSPGAFSRAEVVARSLKRLLVQPLLGVTVEPVGGLQLSSHLGRRERIATFYELFGSEGRIRGNPDLRSERQLSVDAGARYTWRELTLEAVYAFTRADDLVVLVQNGQELPQAQNVGVADIHTLETSLSVRPWRWLSLSGSYTFQRARNGSPGLERDKPLTGRPEHQGRGSITGYLPAPVRSALSVEVQYVGGAYLDRVGTHVAPDRFPISVRWLVRPFDGPIFLQVEVTNLLDQTTRPRDVAVLARSVELPVIDFIGYPLPGRAAFVSFIYALGDRQRALGESLCNASC